MSVSAKKKKKLCEEKRLKFYSSGLFLTVVLLSCIQVNDVHVFQCLTFSERTSHWKVTGPKKKKKKKENDTWKWEKYSVYYSVGDMLSNVTYSYGNIQNKMCKTVSHTVLWALLFSLTSFKYHFNSLIICSLLHCWKVTLVLKWEIPVLWKRTRTDWQCDITDQVSV